MVIRQRLQRPEALLLITFIWFILTAHVVGSLGDRLPDFKECVSVQFAPAFVVLDSH